MVRSELLRGNMKPLESINTQMKVKFTRAFDERVFTRRRYRSTAKNFGAESYVPKNAREVKNEACTAIR